jgi:hypothetical protein
MNIKIILVSAKSKLSVKFDNCIIKDKSKTSKYN